MKFTLMVRWHHDTIVMVLILIMKREKKIKSVDIYETKMQINSKVGTKFIYNIYNQTDLRAICVIFACHTHEHYYKGKIKHI